MNIRGYLNVKIGWTWSFDTYVHSIAALKWQMYSPVYLLIPKNFEACHWIKFQNFLEISYPKKIFVENIFEKNYKNKIFWKITKFSRNKKINFYKKFWEKISRIFRFSRKFLPTDPMYTGWFKCFRTNVDIIFSVFYSC